MKNITTKLSNFLFRARNFLLGFAIILSATMGYFALNLNFNFSPESIYLEKDEAYQFYEKNFLKDFSGTGHTSILAIEKKDDDKKFFEKFKKITERLQTNPHIKKIISPLEQNIYLPTREGIKQFPSTNKNGELTKQAIDYFNEHPSFRDSFISHDQKTFALIFTVDAGFQDQDEQNIAIDSIRNDLSNLQILFPDLIFHVSGVPFVQYEMIRILKSDQLTFLPLVALFLILLLLAMTKHILGAIYPLIIVGVSLVCTLGFLSLVGHEINVVNHAIMMLIMVIGIADAVHIYTRFVDESRRPSLAKKHLSTAAKKEIVVKKTLASMIFPCFLTTATTSLGFLASSAAGVKIIQLFGIDTAIGVMFCFFATFMVLPSLLFLHPLPKRLKKTSQSKWPRILTIDGYLNFSLSQSIKFAKILSFASLVILGSALYLAKDISANQSWSGELPDDNPVIESAQFIEDNFSGTMPFYIVLSGKEDDLLSKENFSNMDKIVKALRKHPLDPTLRSPSDPLAYLLSKNPQNLTLEDIDEKTFAAMQKNMNAYLEDEQEDLADMFWSKNKNAIRIQGFLKNTSTKDAELFREDLKEITSEFANEKISIDLTGSSLISSRALENIIDDMTNSILMALCFITAFVFLIFRSFKLTLIAIFPNLLPIAITVAVLQILEFDVRLATVMTFSMALGLSIDACIHLLCRIQEETNNLNVKTRYSLIKSIFHSFHGSGRPIVYTTVILLGGFSIMMLSQFLALRDFALIAAVTLLSALIADIVLLPALLLVTSKIKNGQNSK